MQEQITVWGLIADASVLVQLVMLLLLAASVISWYLIFQRGAYFRAAKNDQLEFEERFWSGMDLGRLYRESESHPGLEYIFRSGFKEFNRLRKNDMDADAIMEGTQRAMRVALSREADRLDANLPFLATVGSTSPYIGLFGTVWGIMNSFTAIAASKQTSLAVVAPGIAEALFATALGLVAAIPATVAYNKISSDLGKLAGRLDGFSGEFSAIISRQLDEGK